jgi:uncharacterized protein VirK/YbjX
MTVSLHGLRPTFLRVEATRPMMAALRAGKKSNSLGLSSEA